MITNSLETVLQQKVGYITQAGPHFKELESQRFHQLFLSKGKASGKSA